MAHRHTRRGHRRRRDRPRGRRRGAQGRRGRRRRARDDRATSSAPPTTCARARCSPTRCSRSCAAYDAILLGAVGPPVGSTEVPAGLLERGLLLRLRFELDLYVNLRPFIGMPGAPRPDCDFVVVRENTEGATPARADGSARARPHEVATQGSVNTRMGVERCVRFAFELADRRARRAASPWCTRPTCSRSPATSGSAPSTRSAVEYPVGRDATTTTSTPPASTSSSSRVATT